MKTRNPVEFESAFPCDAFSGRATRISEREAEIEKEGRSNRQFVFHTKRTEYYGKWNKFDYEGSFDSKVIFMTFDVI